MGSTSQVVVGSIFDPDGGRFFSILLEATESERAINGARTTFSGVNPVNPFCTTSLMNDTAGKIQMKSMPRRPYHSFFHYA
jgi:hypothetical protein